MSQPDRQTLFRELLERSHARWAGIARAYTNLSDRDDLLQEIALQVWKSLPRFAGRSSVDTWAYRVALNTALAWRRKAKSRVATGDGDVSQVSGATDSQAQHTRVVDEFLASLSKPDRAAMLLFLDDVAPAEAAEILGTTEGALRVRMHRIRRRFEETHREGGADERQGSVERDGVAEAGGLRAGRLFERRLLHPGVAFA